MHVMCPGHNALICKVKLSLNGHQPVLDYLSALLSNLFFFIYDIPYSIPIVQSTQQVIQVTSPCAIGTDTEHRLGIKEESSPVIARSDIPSA